MKTRFIPASLFLLLAVAALSVVSPARAGTAFFDFNSDPTTSGQLQLFGNATWVQSGGVGSATNASDGYLSLTEAVNSENGDVIFSDFDNGQVVKAFSFTAMVKIGDGTGTPADGFSIAYVRANDPILTDPTGGWSGIQDGLGVGGDPEEGTTTGISVGFDAYNNGSGDIAGLDIRVDGQLVLKYPMSTLNGTCTDATSIQTGPLDPNNPGTGDLLCWAPVSVVLDTNALLTVSYKNTVILSTNLGSSYFPSAGRLVMGGRTGGLNELQYVDNISITTIPAAGALVGGATGLPDGFLVTLSDSGLSVVATNTITLKLNGASVTATTIAKSTNGITTVRYDNPGALLPIGSTNQVDVAAQDTLGNPIAGTRAFEVPFYNIIPPGDATPSGSVDLSKIGFRILPCQSDEAQPNTLAWTEDQLAGLHGANNADLTLATDGGYIDFTTVINFNIYGLNQGGTGDAGNFTTANGYPDASLPGIPGANGLTGDSAMEVLTYLQFPAAGVYTMGVNSDDGFRVTEGKNPKDRFALNLGQFDGGRGSSDTLFTFAVQQAGIYPFRLIWENGDGELPNNGANCEWFTVLSEGTKVLIGDPANSSAIKAYYAGLSVPAYVSSVSPVQNSTGVIPNTAVTIRLTDSGTQVSAGSIQLKLDGAGAPSISKTGAVTTVTLSGSLLASGSTNTATLLWSDNATPANSATDSWSFVVQKYVTLNTDLMSPPGSEDPTQPGFVLHVSQLDPATVNDAGDGLPNQMDSMEALLAGLFFPWYGMNVADTSTAVTNNVWYWTNVVDFNIANASPTGDFANDFLLPGIPGTTGSSENLAAAFQTYLVFPQAGFYEMGVNSDDGFRVTEAEGISRQVLHVTGPGIDTDVAAVVSSTNNPAGYGGSLPLTSITAPVVFVDTNSCPNLPSINLTGKIGVIDYQRCGNQNDNVVAYNLQTNGALAAVIINNPSFGLPFVGGGSLPVTIPVIIVNGFGGQRDFWITNANLTASIGADTNLVIGIDDIGKGVSDVNFGFVVPAAGVYPMRLLYEQGGGGAAVEWYMVNPDSTKILLNDGSTPGALKAYRARNVVTRPQFNPPILSGGSITISWTGGGTLQEAPTVPGTWTISANQNNPQTVSAAGTRFYRIQKP
jgi:hypothetical protein